jgi:pyridoxal phosphate enzyme (YggS family)
METKAASIAANLARVRERIARAAQRAGRRPDEITLVAVSKTFPAEAVREAFAAGIRHFGENRVQEWERKQPLLADLDATWHLVGHLQSNKARRAVRLFHTIDSLDSLSLAQRLDAALRDLSGAPSSPGLAGEGGVRRLVVLLEVRLVPEETRSGIGEKDLPGLAEAAVGLPHLDLRGLMTMPPFFDDPEQARPFFRRLRELRDNLRQRLRASGGCHSEPVRPFANGPERSEGAQRKLREESLFPELSMGMSHDFEVAIEEGATHVRLGTAIFGPRQAV